MDARHRLAHSAVAVVGGLIGSLLVALGAYGLSYYGFGTSRADSSLGVRSLGRGLMAAGLPLLMAAWWRARRLPGWWHWPVLALWAVPLLLAPPVLSRDMYAYAEQGFIVLQGLDPYTTPMASRGGPFADVVDVFWRGTTTVYPPGALAVQSWVVGLARADAFWSVALMRVPAVLSLVLIGLLVPRLAEAYGVSADAARWAVLLNPLALLHIIGGGHNDALAAALAVVAVWVACPRTNGGRRWGWLVGAALAGLAASVKQPLLAAVVGVVAFAVPPTLTGARRIVDLAARGVLGLALAAAAFLLVTRVSGLGFGWLVGTGAPQSVKTTAPASLLADAASMTGLVSFAEALRVTGPLLLVTGAAALAWWGWRTLVVRTEPGLPLTFLAGAFVMVVAALPGFQVWYLLWGVPYAAARGWFDRFPRTAFGVVTGCVAVGWLTEASGVPPLPSALAAAAIGVIVARVARIGWRSPVERFLA